MACFYDVEIEDVVEAYNVFFLEDANVAVYVQVLQEFLPHVKTNNSNYIPQSLLKHGSLSIVLIGSVQGALDDD